MPVTTDADAIPTASRARRPRSTLLVCGVLYILVATVGWDYLANQSSLLEHQSIAALAAWWWAILLLPLTVITAVSKLPNRNALGMIVNFILVEFAVWVGIIVYPVFKTIDSQHLPLMVLESIIIALPVGLLRVAVNSAVQLAIFWSIRALSARKS